MCFLSADDDDDDFVTASEGESEEEGSFVVVKKEKDQASAAQPPTEEEEAAETAETKVASTTKLSLEFAVHEVCMKMLTNSLQGSPGSFKWSSGESIQ